MAGTPRQGVAIRNGVFVLGIRVTHREDRATVEVRHDTHVASDVLALAMPRQPSPQLVSERILCSHRHHLRVAVGARTYVYAA